MIRILKLGDEAALEEFLVGHAASSLFLRSNAAAGGLENRGQRLQATYAAAFEGGRIVAVAAHCWHGIVLLQAPERLADVVRAAVQGSGAPVTGFVGPWAQAVAAREALGLGEHPARYVSQEDLFDLPLQELRLPPASDLVIRRLQAEDIADFAALQVEYQVEGLGAQRGTELLDAERAKAELQAREGTAFIARSGDRAVAASLFNARLPDCVQVGGVYTPPDVRGRGFARAVVGASLDIARREGATRAILFTGKDNEPARRAYLSLGFRIVGDYGIVLLEGA